MINVLDKNGSPSTRIRSKEVEGQTSERQLEDFDCLESLCPSLQSKEFFELNSLTNLISASFWDDGGATIDFNFLSLSQCHSILY